MQNSYQASVRFFYEKPVSRQLKEVSGNNLPRLGIFPRWGRLLRIPSGLTTDN